MYESCNKIKAIGKDMTTNMEGSCNSNMIKRKKLTNTETPKEQNRIERVSIQNYIKNNKYNMNKKKQSNDKMEPKLANKKSKK